MRLKVRKVNPDGIVRLETVGELKEILISESLIHPNDESISLCFAGQTSSGIVDLTPKEFEHLYEVVKSKTSLVKGFKTFKGESMI